MAASTAESALIQVADAGHVRHVSIHRPDKQNALDASMMKAIAAAARGAVAAGSALLVISGGTSKNFCAGADLGEFSSGPAGLQAQEEGLHDLIHTLRALPIPIVVLAHGKALGAGSLLVTLADFTLAAENFAFGFPEIQLGLYPVLMHAVLLDRVSNTLAYQLCGTGRILDAAQARDWGLVSEILPVASFTAVAAERVALYARRRQALAIGKRAARTVQPPEDFFRRLESLQALATEMIQVAAAGAMDEFRKLQSRPR